MVYLGKWQLILHIVHTYNIFLSEVAKYMFCQCENTSKISYNCTNKENKNIKKKWIFRSKNSE